LGRFRQEVANSTGWQRERNKNFNQQFTTGKRPANKLGDDGLSNATGLVVFAGNPCGPLKAEEVPAYIQTLHAIDLPRMNRLRDRVQNIVKDPSVAEKLQPWYPTWCKRPCFNDEYLQTFNKDNTTLLDTAGRGLDNITSDSIVVAGQSYPVDIIIFSTGFTAPIGGSPATKGNVSIIGRNNVSMAEEWVRNGPSTLHAVLDANFPNLFLSGPWQGTASANYIFNIDSLAKHAAYIVTTAKSRVKTNEPFVIVPTAAAVEDWGQEILNRSAQSAAMMGCTPSYFNLEGEIDRMKPQDNLKMTRGGLWGTGLESFLEYLEKWRAEGSMEGIEVQV
jgi:cation diffusion facilitator CzcD-associated flavoprotein CzcO